jgi:glycylpeptide N-tetradecanoyltransferase
VYELLTNHYVEDDDGSFRFDYSIDFLRWATCPPQYKPKWHIGVRATKTKKLLAFISGIPLALNIMGKEVSSSEINFLCIHKKLRSKRLAPVLIKEVTRRINKAGIWQAIYTSGTLIPKPFAETKYHFRSINYKKLVEVGFCSKPKNKAM